MAFQQSEADIQKNANKDGVVKGGFKDQQQGFLKKGLADSVTGLDRVAGLQRQDDRFAGGVDGHLATNRDPGVRNAVKAKRKSERDFNLARREAIRRNDRLGAAMIGQHASRSGLQLGGIRKYGADHRAAATGISAGYLDAGQKYQSALGRPVVEPNQGRAGEIPAPFTDGFNPDDYGIPSEEDKNSPASRMREGLDAWVRNRSTSIGNQFQKDSIARSPRSRDSSRREF